MTLKNKGISQETPVSVYFDGSIELPIKGNLAFQPGLLFSAKGTNY
jgi:hypothetical protein